MHFYFFFTRGLVAPAMVCLTCLLTPIIWCQIRVAAHEYVHVLVPFFFVSHRPACCCRRVADVKDLRHVTLAGGCGSKMDAVSRM